MKKLLLLFLCSTCAVAAFSITKTATMTIRLNSQSNNYCDMYIYEVAEFINPIQSNKSTTCFPYTLNTSNVNVFACLSGDYYSQFSAKTISNLPIGIVTNRELASQQNYSLKFSNVNGRNLVFYDKVLDSTMVIPSTGFTYNFTVNSSNCPSYVEGRNTTIVDRFWLEPYAPAGEELKVCNQYNKLEISENPYSNNIVIKNEDGSVATTWLPQATPQTIPLNNLDSGLYTVEFGGGAASYVIAVNPVMTLSPDTSFSVTIDKGEKFLFNCTLRSESGVYTENFPTASGKDSIVHLHLNVYSEPCDTARSAMTQQLCESQLPYTYTGASVFVITKDTVIKDVVVGGAASGCDSIATITFKVNRVVPTTPENKSICEGSFIEWRGQRYTEPGTYFDTVRYVASGCDSARYQMTLRVDPLQHQTKSLTICQRQLPYTYQGQTRAYRIVGDSTFNDTVPSLVGAHCDSITKVEITVVYADRPATEEKVICPGATFEWRGKIIRQPGVFHDTLRYVAGCDSVIYTLVVREQPSMRQLVKDTLCLNEARTKYPQFVITRSDDYIDTLTSVSTGCDSIITYRITLFDKPTVPSWQVVSRDLLKVICGKPMDTQAISRAIEEQLAQAADPKKALVQSFWLEAKLDDVSDFEKINDQLIPEGDGSIKIRIVLLTECGDTIVGTAATRAISLPSADNDPALDNMPAVKKYNNWLLMIHNAQISGMGYEYSEEDVTWYRVQGDIDPVEQIDNDRKVGTGFYYTADQSLGGSYYAIIHDYSDECGKLLRTVVLRCSARNAMTLAPRAIRSGESMTISYLNPDEATQISIYYPDGKLIDRRSIDGVDSYTIHPTQGAGIYLMRVENGDQKEAFKYVITQ